MATYAIGDIQGCLDELEALLALSKFDQTRDKLWFVGDLVNRGPRSLETLRFVKGLGSSAITLLGNHDLHLMAIALGGEPPHPGDTFDEIINAPDSDVLFDWLRHLPLAHYDADLNYLMVHAGVPPQWTREQTLRYAQEVETQLRGPDYLIFFKALYGDAPDVWSEELSGMDRLRYITNGLTRMRFCDSDGRLLLKYKGVPQLEGATMVEGKSVMPWFNVPNRKAVDERIIFGHWSALGHHSQRGIDALDSGCVWGGSLTLMRLDGEPEYFHFPCQGVCTPDV